MSMYSYDRSRRRNTYAKLAKAVMSAYPGRAQIYVTSTIGGRHARTSLHYLGMALDFGSKSQRQKDGLAAWLYPMSKYLNELIHTRVGGGGWYVKNGRRIGGFGPVLNRAHINHVHLGITEAGYAAMIRDPYFVRSLRAAQGRLGVAEDVEMAFEVPDLSDLPLYDSGIAENPEDAQSIDSEDVPNEPVLVDPAPEEAVRELENIAGQIE